MSQAVSEFGRVIFHVDMDSFYASCELSRRPELRNEPYVVGADPMEGKGRGVVLACNYPARKFGLRSGMPISTAWKLCPQAHYDRPHFELYEEMSARVMSLIRPFADKIEQVSIDEAYLEVTNRVQKITKDNPATSAMSAIESLAYSIKKTVKDRENITCSIGVADNKIVAKIATDMNKPDGLTMVPQSKMLDFLAPLEVSKIPGVGHVSQKILLEKFGAKSISDLRKLSLDDLKDQFGKSALWLYNAARGIDESPVIERWEPVSISGETTFFEDESDYAKIRDTMKEVAADVHKRLIRDEYMYRNVAIKIRFSGFETHTRSKSLTAYTASKDILDRETEKLLSEFYESGKKVRLIGVRVSGLLKKDEAQTTLLEWE